MAVSAFVAWPSGTKRRGWRRGMQVRRAWYAQGFVGRSTLLQKHARLSKRQLVRAAPHGGLLTANLSQCVFVSTILLHDMQRKLPVAKHSLVYLVLGTELVQLAC